MSSIVVSFTRLLSVCSYRKVIVWQPYGIAVKNQHPNAAWNTSALCLWNTLVSGHWNLPPPPPARPPRAPRGARTKAKGSRSVQRQVYTVRDCKIRTARVSITGKICSACARFRCIVNALMDIFESRIQSSVVRRVRRP